ncbi:DUF1653 domain-containing protein [Clostridium botulinum]|uniref:DUF1653 domain-containing protein n=1 Tax=Clostridium botulinum TaxID=1491 RepID=UPI001375D2E9|nr:DUF1653 domain-containing protein [Clostridium botulinum]NCI19742.1 DUF1653 domain-containing protein [Clostridium botulinum]NCI35780.1 DUF1653 domain-containing protein [Clostridium botulinum]NCI71637.1 DUF1653 domain-containing protein [Clostridium botulinum]NDI38829.1 DUF1653 domain-containing protein [Clostridium botulinum]
MKRELIYPAIYKHFKGKYYATIGVSNPIPLGYEDDFPLHADFMTIYHTETNKELIAVYMNEKWYHFKEDYDDSLVLYKSLYDNYFTYARPKPMFLSEVDHRKYPEIEQKYRFQLIRY